MPTVLNNIDLTFADYLLLAIILILLHFINVLELVSIKNPNEEVYRVGDLKFQATLTFVGILVTLFCGLIAQYQKNNWIDTVLILFPLLFIVVWFIYQPRSSNFISLGNIHERITIVIQNEISSFAERKGTFTFDDLAKEYSTIVTADILIRNFSSPLSSKMKLPLSGLTEILKPLQFNRADIAQILDNLSNSYSGVLEKKGDTYIYRKSATVTWT
jgi:hypothetical protein